MITQKQLMKELKYCKKTGLFFRKKANTNTVKVGDIAGHKNKLGYIVICVLGKSYLAHRLAWLYVTGNFPSYVIDHINRVKHDNKWVNLRDVTMNINSQNVNVHKDSLSGVKGISYKKGRLSCWQVRVNKKTLGYFKTIEEATDEIKEFLCSS